jgi:hypothetical protein
MNSRRVRLASAIALLLAILHPSVGRGQLSDTFTNWLDHPAIDYTSTPATDPVAQLIREIQQGRVQLSSDGPSGYLRSLLEALDVPVESQIAVFARDSVQRARITAANPRTLFFNDSVAVGWVRGGFIELAAQDPRQGVIFYVLDQTLFGNPRFTSRNDCLTCHYSYSTAGVPGMLVRSAGQFAVNHSVPFEERWGGWYVTGTHGTLRHLGNVDLEHPAVTAAADTTSNWPSFAGKFDTTGYLSTRSDIVALMLFEHQMHLTNLLSRIGWEARVAEYANRHGGAPSEHAATGDQPVPLADAAREIVDYLMFVNEAPLPAEIRGSSGFAERFAAQGPYDRQGRSLRQLDLRRRLLRYKFSYLIYAPVFDRLPSQAKAAIYQRLWAVLSGGDRSAKYGALTLEDRRTVVEILSDTKPDLPDYFRWVVH